MKKIKLMIGTAIMLAATSLFSNSALADWKMDTANSNLSYGTIKNDAIGESNDFNTIKGSITDQGTIKIEIDLTSVNTQIELRDERMRNIAFNVGINPSAILSGNIDISQFETMAIGTNSVIETSLTLDLVGEQTEIDAMLVVIRLGVDKVMVVPQNVLFVDADNYELVGAIEELRKLAGLDTIATVVAMSFYLTFIR